jgi:hypothetical protein
MYFYPLSLEAVKTGIIQGTVMGLISYPLELMITAPNAFMGCINSLKSENFPVFKSMRMILY